METSRQVALLCALLVTVLALSGANVIDQNLEKDGAMDENIFEELIELDLNEGRLSQSELIDAKIKQKITEAINKMKQKMESLFPDLKSTIMSTPDTTMSTLDTTMSTSDTTMDPVAAADFADAIAKTDELIFDCVSKIEEEEDGPKMLKYLSDVIIPSLQKYEKEVSEMLLKYDLTNSGSLCSQLGRVTTKILNHYSTNLISDLRYVFIPDYLQLRTDVSNLKLKLNNAISGKDTNEIRFITQLILQKRSFIRILHERLTTIYISRLETLYPFQVGPIGYTIFNLTPFLDLFCDKASPATDTAQRNGAQEKLSEMLPSVNSQSSIRAAEPSPANDSEIITMKIGAVLIITTDKANDAIYDINTVKTQIEKTNTLISEGATKKRMAKDYNKYIGIIVNSYENAPELSMCKKLSLLASNLVSTVTNVENVYYEFDNYLADYASVLKSTAPSDLTNAINENNILKMTVNTELVKRLTDRIQYMSSTAGEKLARVKSLYDHEVITTLVHLMLGVCNFK